VNDPWRDWIPPQPHWDTVLRLVPAHVFIFDSALVCRYAAPTGGAFLGRSQEQLTGRHAFEILPAAGNGLRPMLERAAYEGSGWSTPQYRYNHRLDGAEIAYIWAIEVEPLAVADQRGVLLTFCDVLELVEERDRLRERSAEREQQLVVAEERVRTVMTSALGYLQILARRPELLRRYPLTSTIEDRVLPRLHEVLQTLAALQHLPTSSSDGS
jgi:hypothetical protein